MSELLENLKAASNYIKKNGLIFVSSAISCSTVEVEDEIFDLDQPIKLEVDSPELVQPLGIFLEPEEACDTIAWNMYGLDGTEYPYCVVEGVKPGPQTEAEMKIWFKWSDKTQDYEQVDEKDVPKSITGMKDIFDEPINTIWSESARLNV